MPVIVEYGVIKGLPGVGVYAFKLKEFVFFKIDFFGWVPNNGWFMASFSFLACGGSISLFAISRSFKISGAGNISKRDDRRFLAFSSFSFWSFSCSSRALKIKKITKLIIKYTYL